MLTVHKDNQVPRWRPEMGHDIFLLSQVDGPLAIKLQWHTLLRKVDTNRGVLLLN